MRLGGRRLALFVLRQKAGLLVYSRGYWIVLDRGWRHSHVVRALSQHQHSVPAVDVARSPTV
jgi:hypothetical protein